METQTQKINIKEQNLKKDANGNKKNYLTGIGGHNIKATGRRLLTL